jgi:prepilin-type N-terminal cleavage/methylation domain-containing protein
MTIKKRLFYYQFWQTCQQKIRAGFTLTELLITILIASIAVSGLLAAMVELLRTDQQEAMREETQQEMQAAMNFIAEDLRESVYIYDGTQRRLVSGVPIVHSIYNFLPSDFSPATPIIAFWKAEPLSATQETILQTTLKNCSLPAPKDEECAALQLSRRTYSLVVYLQDKTPSTIWKGKSRILRYELSKYTSSGFPSLTQSTGYVDPARTNNFTTWPYDAGNNNLQTVRPTGKPEVLVDFVDDPSSTVDDANVLNICPASGYSRLPNNTMKSFFACVRTIGNNIGQNQDIILYLRGNSYGKGGVSNQDELPTLQTRVTLRGVIDKFK